MGALHSRQTPAEGVHTAIAYTYANAAARMGAVGFVTDDLGKLAWQQDDNTFWVLSATAPAWVELTASSILVPGTVSALSLATSQNNLNPASWTDITRQTIFISSTTNINVTGLAAGQDGRIVRIVNVGSFNITLANESGSSTASNRFTLPASASVIIPPGAGFTLIYYGATLRWRATAGNASALNVGTTVNTVAAGDDPRFVKNAETPYDVWYDFEPHRITTLHGRPFVSAAISTGVLNNASFPITDLLQEGRNVVATVRSSATANSGWRWYTENVEMVLFGGAQQQRYVFVARVWIDSLLTNRTIRLGFHDATTSADAVDGVYIEFTGGVFQGKSAANSVRSTTATSHVPIISNWYTVMIETTLDPSDEVTFTVIDETGGQAGVIWTDTLTTNLPNLVARGVGVAAVFTHALASAANIGALAYIGFGTRAAYIQKTQGA
jgi:hypothetical protein